MLSTFEESPGSASKVGHHTIPRSAFSGAGAFPEAEGLYTQYHRVHERLTSLSKMLADQIEAMSIATRGADIGYDNLDDDERRRFHEIQTRINREHDKSLREKPGQKHSDDSKSDSGWYK
ncbi:hypothetical protein [Streptomyces sp. NPDC050560]|uniref:hypothetical protein n=1 Tax=Streptomyces sp. NPDC050560 TaxID=3365630 RepID=UPI003788EB47